MPETSADLLRRAATKIRDTAQATTYGPWVYDDRSMNVRFEGRRTSRENLHPEHVAESWGENGKHIAMWHPGIATLVADVLDDAADNTVLFEFQDDAMVNVNVTISYAIDLARAILGEPA